jgi:hypothetical protein
MLRTGLKAVYQLLAAEPEFRNREALMVIKLPSLKLPEGRSTTVTEARAATAQLIVNSQVRASQKV